MDKIRAKLKKIFTFKRVLFAFIILIASFLWFKYIAGLFLMAAFIPFTYMTVRYSKLVPHISLESNTGMSCFIGYIFGPVFGFFYGLIAGGIAYIGNSFVSPTYLATIFMGGVSALMMGVFHFIGISFTNAFVITIIIRTMIAYFLFGILGTDPFERITHQFSQLVSNLILYLPLLSLLYGIIAPFV